MQKMAEPTEAELEALARSDVRAARLRREYLKAESRLRSHDVRATVVVFGSACLRDPETAARDLDIARAAFERAPSDAATRQAFEKAEHALHRSRYYTIARELGRLVGEYSQGHTESGMCLVTGGGAGAMEAANRGASDVHAHSAGFNIALPREQKPNPYITPSLQIEFRYFALRKLHFMLRAKALVVLPGGYGTLDELFETLCLVQTGKHEPIPIILIGSDFWSRAIDFDFLQTEGVITATDRALFALTDTAREAWAAILAWYARRGLAIGG